MSRNYYIILCCSMLGRWLRGLYTLPLQFEKQKIAKHANIFAIKGHFY